MWEGRGQDGRGQGKDLLATDDGRDAGTPVGHGGGVQRGSRARLSVRRERCEIPGRTRRLGSRRVEGRGTAGPWRARWMR